MRVLLLIEHGPLTQALPLCALCLRNVPNVEFVCHKQIGQKLVDQHHLAQLTGDIWQSAVWVRFGCRDRLMFIIVDADDDIAYGLTSGVG